MADTSSVRHAVAETRNSTATPRLQGARGRTRNPWPALEVGLLRDLAGLTLTAAATLLGTGVPEASKRYALHRATICGNAPYLDLVAAAARRALDVGLPPEGNTLT